MYHTFREGLAMEPYTSYLGYTSRLLCTVLFCVFAGIAPPLHAQPFTKKFIMPFHTCDKAISSNCNDPINHVTRLAESDNGTQWSLVLGFTPLKGGGIIPPVSVPDLIQRGNKAYLYVPSAVYIYDGSTGKWSSNTTYTITDESGASIRFVDPSPMLDAQGRIVLFFLNSSSSGQGMDPAGCSSYPCTKRFDSAIEVEGSDGKRFVMQSGPRVQITLDGAMLRTGSDPDIYYDGTKYVLYVSAGASTLAFSSTTLHGSYTPLIGTTGLLTSIGGVPCGHYDTETKRYWTFVQSNEGGTNVIKRAVHADFSRQLGASDFTTVMSASTLGLGTQTNAESPGITLNAWLNATSVQESAQSLISQPIVSPNPASDIVVVKFTLQQPQHVSLKIFNALGQEVSQIFDTELAKGEYTYQLSTQDCARNTSAILFVQLNIQNSTLKTIPIQVLR